MCCLVFFIGPQPPRSTRTDTYFPSSPCFRSPRAMAFSPNSDGGALSYMNIIPLWDGMLVLLVIFMMTAPIPSYPINIDLPQRSLNPPLNPLEPPEPIRLRIDQSGTIFWNDSPTPLSALRNMMETEVQRDVNNQPTLE